MLAFSVQEMDEGTGGIVFAKSNVAARRYGANQYNDGEFAGLRVQRQAWADQFAPGPVPFAELFARGWYQECCGCGDRIEDGAEDRHGKPKVFNIVEDNNGIFCRPRCRQVFLTERRHRKAAEERAKAALKEFIQAKIGQVEFVGSDHAFVQRTRPGWIASQVIVRFSYPGAQLGPATCRFERRHHELIGPVQPLFYCPTGDQDAFTAYRLARKNASETPPAN